ncbi:MAG TPA: DUF2798 domain-containing protein [Thiopseudomonas sp.]|nr:DUF2798 domain-containing protein [Thiopseudomonas sp.]
MIAPRFAPLVFSILMSLYMVTAMTCVITLVNTGLAEGFLLRWFRAFYIAWPVAFLLIMVGAPRIQKFVAQRIKKID